MRSTFTFLLLLSFFTGFSQTAPPAELAGEDLRNWLKTNWHTGKHTELGYSSARLKMYSEIDVKEDGRVYGVYSGFSQPAAETTFLDPINCEHTVPQSFFGEAEPMKSDIHHLFPTHGKANSARLNYGFGDIPDELTDVWYGNVDGTTLVESSNVPAINQTEYSESEPGRFEPREDHKGDVARAIFYYYTMYPGTAGDISRIIVGGKIESLYAWHLQDPVSAWEKQRNDRIEAVQGDRNPFIDYPDLACRAFNLSCDAVYLSIKNALPEFSAYENEPSTTFSFNLQAVGEFSELTLSSGKGFYLTLDGTTYEKELSLSASALELQNIGVRFDTTGVGVGTYSSTLTALVNAQEVPLATLRGSIVAQGNGKLLAFENFEDGNWELRGWEVISKSSNRNWGYTEEGNAGTPGIEMNGYNGDAASDDWLISPELVLPTESSYLEFMAYSRFSGGDALTLLISQNYVPGTDPDDADWQPLPSTLAASGTGEWLRTIADLETYQGSTVHFAFHYVASGSYPSWILDDFKVLTGKEIVPYKVNVSPALIEVSANTDTVYTLTASLERPAEGKLTLNITLQGAEQFLSAVTTQPAMSNGILILTIPEGNSAASAQVSVAPIAPMEVEVVLEFAVQTSDMIGAGAQLRSAITIFPKEDEIVDGIEEIQFSGWKVGPNPTNGKVYGINQLGCGGVVQIVSATGQQLKTVELINSGQWMVDISSLPHGLYFLLIQETNGRIYQTRIIKQ